MPAPAPTKKSRFAAPSWVQSFYSKFPLVVLEQEDELPWKQSTGRSLTDCCLWVHPPAESSHPHHRSWASASPESLRIQLLFLLRKAPISFRIWVNEQAAPGSRLPTLQLLDEEKLVPSEEIRAWLDQKYPLKGKGKQLQNMPSQEAYDRGVALANLVLGPLSTALASTIASSSAASTARSLPNPPPLAAGLKTPLPAALTGDDRILDHDDILGRGLEALEVISGVIDGGWALAAGQPTPLDALLGAYLYAVLGLESATALRRKVEELPNLGDYLDSVLTYAGASVRE